MFYISEKHSGKEKKESLEKFRKAPQKYRKSQHPISRELYRYYNPDLHKKIWNPNGLFLREQYYYYIGPSLGFKDKEEQKKYTKNKNPKIDNKNNKDKIIIKDFPEYNFLKNNEYKIIIEYCSNCEEHQVHTFHNSATYKNYAIKLQKCILLRFPFIQVLLKPIDTDIKKIKNKLPKIGENDDDIKNKYNIKIGAFEVLLIYNQGNSSKKEILFSKLNSKKFPLILNILDKIAQYMPLFKGKIYVYEKEENKNKEKDLLYEDDNKNNLRKKELIEGLEIKIYLLNNIKIINLANEALETIQKEINPEKRLLLIKQKKIIKKIKMNNNKYYCDTNYVNNNKSNNRYNITNNNNDIYMPFSSTIKENENEKKLIKSYSALNIQKKNNKLLNSDDIYTYTLKNNDILTKNKKNKYIYDKTESEKLKGELISQKYTNKEGFIEIGPLPYDSYYIEVKESKQFRNVGLCLNFRDLNLYKNNFIEKYIGLLTQENSFIQIHVYELIDINKNNTNYKEPRHVPNAKVILKAINSDVEIELKETINSGIFEHTVPPGNYLIEVEKKDYEKSKKYISLKKGFNTIDIAMNIERYYNLHIIVLNYEDFTTPVNNADITIYQNSEEILNESITNKNGEYIYVVDKDKNMLTISIEKMGYFPEQRIFIRNKKAKINEKGEYEENITFFLVNKDYVMKNNLIILLTYCNSLDNNFDPNGILVNDKIKEKVIISCNDGQKESGFISTVIKYKNNFRNYNNNDDENDNNFDNIITLSYIITSNKLLENIGDKIKKINGLERYACQTIIYTPKNIFYIPSPMYSEKNYGIWFLGWLDLKNKLFYQTNILIQNLESKSSFFNEWLDFLQALIDDKIYLNLFEFFGFEKGNIEKGDRTLDENTFIENIKNINYFTPKNDITNFICSLFKNSNNMISFTILKGIVSSNLKNFFDFNHNENEQFD
jgi:hypothetical protein